MKCPKCHTENPNERKFCRECGAKLLLACPRCGAEILPSDKFCGECGQNLTLPSKPIPKDLSHDEKLEKIQRYLPKGLTEKILVQRDRIEGENNFPEKTLKCQRKWISYGQAKSRKEMLMEEYFAQSMKC